MKDISIFVNRLKACGFSPDRAALIVDDFLRQFRGSYFELEQFIKSVEGEKLCGRNITLTLAEER